MTGTPSPEEILKFRRESQKMGIDLSRLTDREVARQLAILRGGLGRPTPGELAEIRGRAKKTEPIFEKNELEVLTLLKKALQDLESLERKLPSRSGTKRPGKEPEALVRRMSELHRKLLAYPPSILRPELQEALREIAGWAAPDEPGRKSRRKRPTPQAITRKLDRWVRSVSG